MKSIRITRGVSSIRQQNLWWADESKVRKQSQTSWSHDLTTTGTSSTALGSGQDGSQHQGLLQLNIPKWDYTGRNWGEGGVWWAEGEISLFVFAIHIRQDFDPSKVLLLVPLPPPCLGKKRRRGGLKRKEMSGVLRVWNNHHEVF